MEFPGGNPGIWPVDPTTDTGKFRYAYGDIEATAYNPDEPGYRNFGELSDAEIEGFLAAGGSVYRAIALYYVQLAGKAALTGAAIRDHDLQVDTKARAADLRALAQYWFDLADGEDAGSEDSFLIVPTGGQGGFIPEGTVPIYGRRYEIGVWRYGV